MGRVRRTSAQVQVKDDFRALPEYCVDPLTITAIGLKLGEQRMQECILAAKRRGIREFAIIGDTSIRVMLRPPPDAWPPEPWMHEWVKPKYLAQAKAIISEE